MASWHQCYCTVPAWTIISIQLCLPTRADGGLLAAGCHDGQVYVYEVLEEGQAYKKHKGGILKVCAKHVHNSNTLQHTLLQYQCNVNVTSIPMNRQSKIKQHFSDAWGNKPVLTKRYIIIYHPTCPMSSISLTQFLAVDVQQTT